MFWLYYTITFYFLIDKMSNFTNFICGMFFPFSVHPIAVPDRLIRVFVRSDKYLQIMYA